MNRSSPKNYNRIRGFTLVELLVVIGIIALLVGILLPVIGAARRAAYAADTRNSVRGISNAIDRYYQEQSAYPGVFSNTAIASGKSVTGSPGSLTSTENCVLALTGGITTTAAWSVGMVISDATGFTYSSANLGRGPLTFNSVLQKRLPAYMEITSQLVSTTPNTLDSATSFGLSEPNRGVNTGVPEFIDRFPGPMPIIYLRARVSGAGVVGVDTVAATFQYDHRQLLPYVLSNSGAFAFDTTTFPANVANDPATIGSANFAGCYNYFFNAGAGVVKNKDTYILISPGQDRKYGTSDDICNFTF